MDITLEQARAFVAIHQQGTIQKAASALNKGHSAILYLIKNLEQETGLNLFDRSGYRNQISPEGEVVLRYCEQMLASLEELSMACTNLKQDWEPSLKLIYDGVVDFNLIAAALKGLNQSQTPTEIKIISAYLKDVEEIFFVEKADMMVTVLPLQVKNMNSIHLPKIEMHLVAHKSHPLANKRKLLSSADLELHTFIRVRQTAGLLNLSTDSLSFSSSFFVNDFATKKQTVASGLGFGWMPEYLIETELEKNQFVVLKTEIENNYTFHPRLIHRKAALLGKAAQQILNHF